MHKAKQFETFIHLPTLRTAIQPKSSNLSEQNNVDMSVESPLSQFSKRALKLILQNTEKHKAKQSKAEILQRSVFIFLLS